MKNKRSVTSFLQKRQEVAAQWISESPFTGTLELINGPHKLREPGQTSNKIKRTSKYSE